jgi:hypothetical protein
MFGTSASLAPPSGVALANYTGRRARLPELRTAREDQERLDIVRREGDDVGVSRPQQSLHIGGRTVAEAYPDYFRRRPAKETARQEVVIL